MQNALNRHEPYWHKTTFQSNRTKLGTANFLKLAKLVGYIQGGYTHPRTHRGPPRGFPRCNLMPIRFRNLHFLHYSVRVPRVVRRVSPDARFDPRGDSPESKPGRTLTAQPGKRPMSPSAIPAHRLAGVRGEPRRHHFAFNRVSPALY